MIHLGCLPSDPWLTVNRMIRQCHVRNFSIHQREVDGKLYLFAHLEYTGKDFDADMKQMAADPCQSPLPEAALKGKIWAGTREVHCLP